jgi:ligand-binding sensor domain-containing protein
LPAVDIAQILCPPTGPYYLAGLYGLFEFYAGNDSLVLLGETKGQRISCLLAQGDSLWYGTLGRGLKVMSRQRRTLLHTYLENTRRITGIIELPDHNSPHSLFIATSNDGCFRLTAPSQTPLPLLPPDGIMSGTWEDEVNQIMAVRQIDSLVWIATKSAGCILYDPRREAWGRFTYYQGLLSDRVRSLCDNERYIWIGSYGGLTRLEKGKYPALIPREPQN